MVDRERERVGDMRIGLIAPPWIAVPPPAYGGTEAVIDGLARGLTGLGHDIRLYTVGESTCPVPRSYLYPRAAEPMGDVRYELAHALVCGLDGGENEGDGSAHDPYQPDDWPGCGDGDDYCGDQQQYC